MRGRMRGELDKSDVDHFDIKQGPGGMIDIEFLVQHLVLLHALKDQELLYWSDNIRQLDALRDAGILDADIAEALADAYRGYRERGHLLSLTGESRLAAADDFEAERALIKGLWNTHLSVEGDHQQKQ